MKFEKFVVKEIAHESEGIRTFVLAKENGAIPAYVSGHFFLLRLADENGKPVQRSYSAASHPSEPRLSFCIKLKGIFTNLLWKLKEGDSIEVDGPYGVFLLRAEDTERVFIGGGVGISALRSQILQTIKEGKPCFLFHSAKTLEGLTYHSEMEKLAAAHSNFKAHFSLTGETLPDGWKGMKGRVNVAVLKEKLGSLSEKTFYLCGSKEMAAEISNALIGEGVPKDRIKKDDWV